MNAGIHDIFATTTDRIALRRGIAVADDTVVTEPIDVISEGEALVGVNFTSWISEFVDQGTQRVGQSRRDPRMLGRRMAAAE